MITDISLQRKSNYARYGKLFENLDNQVEGDTILHLIT